MLWEGLWNKEENENGDQNGLPKVSERFLIWLKDNGNDLITPRPEYNFEGLKNGDNWCVCASWYAKAVKAGHPCKVYIRSTNIKTLDHIDLPTLKKHALDLA